MSERADSMLVFDLRAFARDYSGSPLAGRLRTAANELDRLYEVERRAFGGMGRGIGETPKETPIPHGKETENAAVSFEVELHEALRIFVGCAYPVSPEINPRGHNWSEGWLDEALANARTVLKAHESQTAHVSKQDHSEVPK